MIPRFPFWLGLLLGGAATFSTRLFWLPTTVSVKASDALLDSVGEAVVVSDASGAVTYANAAALALLGPQAEGIGRLCYPSGQKVPLGQLPLTRALRTGKAVVGTGYLFTPANGMPLALDVSVKPLPDGGAAATLRDVTAIHEGKAREASVTSREQVLRDLCRRLNAASDAAQLGRAVVESVLAMGENLPDLRVRLYTYDSESKSLTQLASAPEERAKSRQRPSPIFPFHAQSPLLWSVYVERRSYLSAPDKQDASYWEALGETEYGAAYAVPLLAGGVAVGHLSIVSSEPDAWANEEKREAFHLIASVAALALAGPQQAAQTAQLAEQVGALREVVQAVGRQTSETDLVNLISRHVLSVTSGEVCTVALKEGESLRLAGTSYQDALLFPERPVPEDAVSWEAVRTGKTVSRVGLPNPLFEDGVWRAFAGQSGKHSILAVPLGMGQGALTVWALGEAPFSAAQVTFLETVTALLTAALSSASPREDRAGL
jgi:transcriptional regulator with GAF, ATPase, and Fis domain